MLILFINVVQHDKTNMSIYIFPLFSLIQILTLYLWHLQLVKELGTQSGLINVR